MDEGPGPSARVKKPLITALKSVGREQKKRAGRLSETIQATEEEEEKIIIKERLSADHVSNLWWMNSGTLETHQRKYVCHAMMTVAAGSDLQKLSNLCLMVTPKVVGDKKESAR